MMYRIRVLFGMIIIFVIITIVLANEIRKKDELLGLYQEYSKISQQVIAQQEQNLCLQDEIIKYYEYAEIPSQLQCPLPMAVR
jgi:cell division protein FtsL